MWLPSSCVCLCMSRAFTILSGCFARSAWGKGERCWCLTATMGRSSGPQMLQTSLLEMFYFFHGLSHRVFAGDFWHKGCFMPVLLDPQCQGSQEGSPAQRWFQQCFPRGPASLLLLSSTPSWCQQAQGHAPMAAPLPRLPWLKTGRRLVRTRGCSNHPHESLLQFSLYKPREGALSWYNSINMIGNTPYS